MEQLGYRVILAEYPGYGARTGQPSESVFIEDSLQTALLVQQSFDGSFFLWGESLGTGVVSGIVKTGKVKTDGIILMMPFDSLPNIAQHHYWFFLGKERARNKFVDWRRFFCLSLRRGNRRIASYATVATTQKTDKKKLVVEVISCTFLNG